MDDHSDGSHSAKLVERGENPDNGFFEGLSELPVSGSRSDPEELIILVSANEENLLDELLAYEEKGKRVVEPVNSNGSDDLEAWFMNTITTDNASVTEVDDVVFNGLPILLSASVECAQVNCIIPVSAAEQDSLGSSSQTHEKRKRKRALKKGYEVPVRPLRPLRIRAPSSQNKRWTIRVRVDPSLRIHHVDFLVVVNASDKVIVLRETLWDIARNLPFFFIGIEEIDGQTHYIHLEKKIESLSFEEAEFRDGSIILAASPCFAFLYPAVCCFCRVCTTSSKRS